MRIRPLHRWLASGLTAALTATGLTVLVQTAPASAVAAQTALPVNYSFASAFAATYSAPATSPPGANNFFCRPSAAHPYPVILVHGTFENMDDNWQAGAPVLANHGYCVFAFNYGGSSSTANLQGTEDIAASAGQLESFVNLVRAVTGAAKVDLVGHSQGGMMPRYYINFLGGTGRPSAGIPSLVHFILTGTAGGG